MSDREPPPPVIGYDRVVAWAVIDESAFNPGGIYVGGEELGRVPRLAIGESSESGEAILFYCASDWSVQAVSTHPSEDAARARAERSYPSVSGQWIDSGVTRDHAEAFVAERDAEVICSFCGRRPDQIQRLVSRGAARICDVCITQFACDLKDALEQE